MLDTGYLTNRQKLWQDWSESFGAVQKQCYPIVLRFCELLGKTIAWVIVAQWHLIQLWVYCYLKCLLCYYLGSWPGCASHWRNTELKVGPTVSSFQYSGGHQQWDSMWLLHFSDLEETARRIKNHLHSALTQMWHSVVYKNAEIMFRIFLFQISVLTK